jgi:hypothetical protein
MDPATLGTISTLDSLLSNSHNRVLRGARGCNMSYRRGSSLNKAFGLMSIIVASAVREESSFLD